jgi:hypothetical protein
MNILIPSVTAKRGFSLRVGSGYVKHSPIRSCCAWEKRSRAASWNASRIGESHPPTESLVVTQDLGYETGLDLPVLEEITAYFSLKPLAFRLVARSTYGAQGKFGHLKR